MDKFKAVLEFRLIDVAGYQLTVVELGSSLAILLIAIVLSRNLSNYMTRIITARSRISPTQLYTFNRIFSWAILAIGVLLSLGMLGLSTDKLMLVVGALGVGIGFGLQNIVNNFVSGIIILFEKSLRVGDFVELESGLLGEVKEINIRSTLIRTLDNADILVPNSEFINNRVNNWTLSDDERRFLIPFGVAYGSDPQKVQEVVLEEIKKVPFTLSGERREPSVVMTEFGDSSLDFDLVVWLKGDNVKRPGLVRSSYLLAIHKALIDNAIEIPFPQRDLHIRSGLTSVAK